MAEPKLCPTSATDVDAIGTPSMTGVELVTASSRSTTISVAFSRASYLLN